MTMMIILVFIFSGLQVMEMAILEEVTVSNEQRKMQAYQVAYSELDAQMANLAGQHGVLNDALSGEQSLTPLLNPATCSSPGDICQTVSLEFKEQTPPPVGYSVSNFMGFLYEIHSSARILGSGAESDQTLSFIYVVDRR